MDGTVGFVGTGAMGGGMALRLLDAGRRLVVHDASPEALRPLLERGATAAASPREVADAATVVFACLPSPEASRTVVDGPDGIAAGRVVEVYVEASTIGEPTAQALAARLGAAGIGFVDAPVSGGPHGARAGTLSVLAAGDPARLDRLAPLFAAFADKVFRVGTRPGAAQVCKLVNNAISIAAMAVTCEAVVLGVKAGADAHGMIDAINASTGRTSASTDKFPKAILPRTFDYGGPLSIGSKDLALYLEMAERHDVPVDVLRAVERLWAWVVEANGPERDYSTLILPLERRAGVVVGG
jgi:3-hydroxyisobutyrate dehydrogenase-like beta-hydroxyacid dehydrogenase